MGLKDRIGGCWLDLSVLQEVQVVGLCEHGNEPSHSIKLRKSFD